MIFIVHIFRRRSHAGLIDHLFFCHRSTESANGVDIFHCIVILWNYIFHLSIIKVGDRSILVLKFTFFCLVWRCLGRGKFERMTIVWSRDIVSSGLGNRSFVILDNVVFCWNVCMTIKIQVCQFHNDIFCIHSYYYCRNPMFIYARIVFSNGR